MSFAPEEKIFISYSRSDGRAFAEAFERRLVAEGVQSWRDLKDMGAGDIRPQVLRAIEGTKHLVLILSRRALVSDWIKREWSHARQMGKQISPVLADPSLSRADLPAWMKRAEVFDIDPKRDRKRERWKQLVAGLRGDGRVKPVPYMPGDLSADFVPRPAEFDTLKAAVLAETPAKTVALTTALLGAGGYGKTTLANALCRDPDVRFAFSDGILRVEIGKDRADVTGLVADLIKKLDPGNGPGFTDVVTASEHLGELLGESRILLVIDDVWREAQLRPFLRGGPNCVRLVTTRLPGVLPPGSHPVPIDEMRAAQAVGLLGAGLPGAADPAIARRLAALAEDLGYWAQMLAIANGWLRERVQRGEPLIDSVARFEQRLARDGPFAFDPKNETQRNKAIRICIEASTQDLDAGEAARFSDLAVLPEDEDVPLAIVTALWAETGGLDEDKSDDLFGRLDGLSLLQSLDRGRRTLRLHDNVLWYLRDRLGADGLKAAHAAMVRVLRAACAGVWRDLPPDNRYGWRFLIAHLRGADDHQTAASLRTDYAWIKAKLHATDARSLYGDYLAGSTDLDIGRIGRAIGLSLPALMADKRALAQQLYGRLGETGLPCATAALNDPDCRPRPRWPGLTPPGPEILCLRGHKDAVNSAAFSPDGARIVTASIDRTARLWDAATGAEIAALRGHEDSVRSAAFSPDGARIVTASDDGTARLWDAATGAEIAALRGHEGRVSSAAFSPDGARIVTASDDRTARIWNAGTGAMIAGLRSHRGMVVCAAFSPDGVRVVTAENDRTAHVWDGITGAGIAVLRGHRRLVTSAAFSPDGASIVTASDGWTVLIWNAATGAKINHGFYNGSTTFSPDGARLVSPRALSATIWDATTGAHVATLDGHEDLMQSAAFSPDGDRIVTASRDKTARIWDASGTAPICDAASGSEIAARRGHKYALESAAFSPDGARVVTTAFDGPRIWDVATGSKIDALGELTHSIRSAVFSPDGGRIATTSKEKTALILDAVTGAEIAALRGHMSSVHSVAFSLDGARIVTASEDRTARIWDAVTGTEATLPYWHEDQVESAAFSPDGDRIVTASRDKTARVWDAATGAEIAALRGHEVWVKSASFSPDGARIVTASFDRTARLWDAATGAEIAILRGHEDWVRHAAFSPNGTRIVTASDDRTARIWDAATGGEIARVTLDAGVTALAIHGTAIALGDALGRIHVFDAEEFLG